MQTAPGRMPVPGVITAPMVIALIAAAVIAAGEPFDLAFGASTFGVPAFRAALIVVLALVGECAGARAGLRLTAPAERHPILAPVLVAAVVAVFCAGVDWAFRPALSPGYVHVIADTPVFLRIPVFMMRAFNENIIYRLFLGSTLAWTLGHIWRDTDGRPTQGAFWCAFAASQALNVWINVASQAPISAVSLLHDLLRYFAPGMIWSWLYLRRGFQANEIASTSVHLMFQPLVGSLLLA